MAGLNTLILRQDKNGNIAAGEYVMLDTRNLSTKDLTELQGEIAAQGLTDKVQLWP